MAINMGADDYVTKPFEMTVLLAKIQGFLEEPMTLSENKVYSGLRRFP